MPTSSAQRRPTTYARLAVAVALLTGLALGAVPAAPDAAAAPPVEAGIPEL